MYLSHNHNLCLSAWNRVLIMSSNAQQQNSIYIVRYGLTEFPLVEDKGPYDSDIDPNQGIPHAQAISERLSQDISTSKDTTVILSSPFLRTTHTASIIADKLQGTVLIEEGLTEWQIPSLLVEQDTGSKTNPRTVEELSKMFSNIDTSYQSGNPFQPDWFPESDESKLLKRCATTLEKILETHSSSTNFILVSHAPCDQALALYLEGNTNAPEQSNLTPWPLGGITKFTSSSSPQDGGWTLEWYGDTQHVSFHSENLISTYGFKYMSLILILSNLITILLNYGTDARRIQGRRQALVASVPVKRKKESEGRIICLMQYP